MLSITRKVEYALIGLAHIAAQTPGSVVTVREVSERYHIPGKLLAKVFHEMKGAHLLRSHQGKNGGYSLATDPSQLTLASVIDLLEGHAELVICCDGEGYQCPQSADCNIHDPMHRLNHKLRGFLGQVTVLDFVAGKAARKSLEN